MHSDDAGRTWSAPANVSGSCQHAGDVPGVPLNGATPCGGHGIQLSSASGRLVVPFYGGSPVGAYLCYSDDHGAKWQPAARSYPRRVPSRDPYLTWDEVEVAELLPATEPPTLYMTIRYAHSHSLNTSYRRYSISHDAGLTWSDPPVPMRCGAGDCPDPCVKGSVVTWPGRNGSLIFSNSASSEHSVRVNQTVHISLDGGANFAHSLLISSLSGYTTLQVSGDGLVANLFERHSRDLGCELTLAKVDPRAILREPPGPLGASGGL